MGFSARLRPLLVTLGGVGPRQSCTPDLGGAESGTTHPSGRQPWYECHRHSLYGRAALGTLASEERLEGPVNDLRDSQVIEVSLSPDSLDPATFDVESGALGVLAGIPGLVQPRRSSAFGKCAAKGQSR